MLLTQGNWRREPEFLEWNKVFHLVRCIPQNEIVVLAGDMNQHVGSRNVGYFGKHGWFWVWRQECRWIQDL